jgi:thymidylate synthase
MENHFASPADAFVETVEYIQRRTTVVAPRDKRTVEVMNCTLIIAEPWMVPFYVEGRQLNHTITGLEFAQLLGQTSCETAIRERVFAVAAYHDHGISYGNYGTRVHGQLTNVVKQLVADPSSRRAVVSIYHGPSDLRQETKDIPCTLSLQFLIRDGSLYLRTSMRSNDVWLGLPYDLMQFCMLQCAMAQILDVPIGEYCHTVGSMHMYERDLVHDKLGERVGMDIQSEAMMHFDTTNPLSRLEEAVTFCQDVVYGYAEPLTSFEEWLCESVKA